MLKKTLLIGLMALPFTIHAGNKMVSADIINNAGKKIGEVKLTQGTEGVVVNIKAQGLPPGYHGMHFHAVGNCSDNDKGFKLSKGHVNPLKKPHGFVNPKGPHEGNLPNLVVAADGSVEVEMYTQMVSLTSGNANLLDKDGSALIIHANKDDHNAQPIGGSGARIGCAVIK